MADLPNWLAPTVVLSAFGTTANFGWSAYNAWRAARLRSLEHSRGHFTLHVTTPIEGGLAKLEEFLAKAKVVERSTVLNPSCTAAERAQRYKALQAETLEPARDSFHIALGRAGGQFQHPTADSWYDYEDLLDPILDAFDTLCRPDAPDDRARSRAASMEGVVQGACMRVRRDMDEMVRRVGGLR